MKRIIFVICVIFVSAKLFATPTYAGGEDFIDQFSDISGIGEEELEGIGPDTLIKELALELSDKKGEISAFFLFVLGSAFALALLGEVCVGKYARRGAYAAVSAGIFMQSYKLVTGVSESLTALGSFFAAAMPVMTGITLAGGGVSSASSEALGMGLALSTVSGICIPILIPIVFLMFAASAFSSLGSDGAQYLSRLRSVFMWLMGIATAIFMGGISLQSIISNAKDSALVRAAKYSASGLIPIVGSTVSASLSTLGAGLSYAKSIVGAGAVYMLFTIALAPLLILLIYRFILSVAGSFLEFAGIKDGALPFSAAASCFDALSAVYAMCSMIFLFEIIVFMKSGVALA